MIIIMMIIIGVKIEEIGIMIVPPPRYLPTYLPDRSPLRDLPSNPWKPRDMQYSSTY